MSIPGTYTSITSQSSGITYIGSGGRQAETNNLVLAFHANTVIGDFVVAYLQYDDSTVMSPTTPTGWTSLVEQNAAGIKVRIIYRFYDGTAPTIVISPTEHILASTFTLRGVSSGNPIDNSYVVNPDITFGSDAGGYYVDVAGTSTLNTVTPNAYVLAVAAHETDSGNNNYYGTLVSYNLTEIQELADYSTSLGWGGGVGVWGGYKTTAGSIAPVRVHTSALRDHQAIVFALRPA